MLQFCAGIGRKCSSRLENLNVESVLDLQQCDPRSLIDEFGDDMAATLKQLSHGEDPSAVVATGQPQASERVHCPSNCCKGLTLTSYDDRSDISIMLGSR